MYLSEVVGVFLNQTTVLKADQHMGKICAI